LQSYAVGPGDEELDGFFRGLICSVIIDLMRSAFCQTTATLATQKEAPVRTLIVLAFAALVAAIGFRMKDTFVRASPGDPASIAKAMATIKPLWPHEIHRNYENMKELPVRETKEPF
jgi:hypothetical protein